MKKFLIPILAIMFLLPFMYGGCLSSDDIADITGVLDLAGTWAGPGHYFDEPDGESNEIFVDIELTLGSDGKISDATINDDDVTSDLIPEGVTLDDHDIDINGLLEFFFSDDSTAGVIFFQNDLNYLYFFSHYANGNAFADGTLEKGGTSFSGTPPDLVGSWAGFGFDFFADGSSEKFTISDFVVTMPSVDPMVTGTDPDGNSFTGTLFPHPDFNTNGSFWGELSVADDGYMGIYYAFMSPNKQVIGFLTWGSSEGWSAVLLKNNRTHDHPSQKGASAPFLFMDYYKITIR